MPDLTERSNHDPAIPANETVIPRERQKTEYAGEQA